jgi:hypothetical protein
MNAKVFDAIVIGGRSVGLTLSKVMLLRPDDVVDSEFDETVHTWRLKTRAGDSYDASVLISYGEAPSPAGMVPYLGVAVHGLPNRFFITGPDARGQQQYIAHCLNTMPARTARGSVRHSAHLHRALPTRQRSELAARAQEEDPFGTPISAPVSASRTVWQPPAVQSAMTFMTSGPLDGAPRSDRAALSLAGMVFDALPGG